MTELTLGLGSVLARVDERQVRGRARPSPPGIWSSLAAHLATRPAALAALLEGELPLEVLAGHGLSPMPARRDVAWTCECGSRDGECGHVGTAWEAVESALDREPALVLTLRGCDAGALAREASGLAAARSAAPDPGVDAASAYDCSARDLPPIPDILLPVRPGRPEFTLDPAALPHQRLHDQAAEAAGRALDVLLGEADGSLDLDRLSDLARLGASLGSAWDVDHLAWRAGLAPSELRGLVAAWRARRGTPRPLTFEEAGPSPAATEDEEALDQLSLF